MRNKKIKIEKEESILVGICHEFYYSIELLEKRLLASKEFSTKKDGDNYIVSFLNQKHNITIKYRNNIKEIIGTITKNQYFSLKDRNILDQANKGIEVAMKYNGDILDAYHLHLKVLTTILPELNGVLDISSLKILNKSWVKMASEAIIPPDPVYLVNFHGVIHENESVWLHSHGLRRCGYREIEISDLTKEYINEGGQILEYLAKNMLTSKSFETLWEKEVFWLLNNFPLTFIEATAKIEERDENHGDFFELALYETEENYQKGVISPIELLTPIIKENPLFYLTESETKRMSILAREREKYLLNVLGCEGYYPLIKFGIATDEPEENGELEHLWFEVISYNEKKYEVKLKNQPYFIKGLNEGDTLMLDKKQMTDWLIYFEDMYVTPDTSYILKEKGEELNNISIN